MEKIQNIINVEEKNEVNKIAKQLLKEIGIKQHISGFKYWLEALTIATIREDEKKNIKMTNLYLYIAKKYKITAARVERNMRYAYCNLNLENVFNTNYKINNSALLFLLKDEIITQLYT